MYMFSGAVLSVIGVEGDCYDVYGLEDISRYGKQMGDASPYYYTMLIVRLLLYGWFSISHSGVCSGTDGFDDLVDG